MLNSANHNTAEQADTCFDLVVVGAGPAGLAAALTAADHGLRVVVIDEQHDVGGQIFRQAPSTFQSEPSSAFKSYPFGRQLLERARQSTQIQWRFGCTAWGIFRTPDQSGVRVAINRGNHAALIDGAALLIATGAYDLPVAFPGWTLPGVMSAGGVQTLMKSQFLRPGMRFVLAGSHPLLLLVADLLIESGAQVAEVAIARPKPSLAELLSAWRALPGHLNLFRQMAGALGNLRRHRVPIRFGTLLTRAIGNQAVEQVVLSDATPAWEPIAGTERTLQADTLVTGYGLLASTELARQAGCASIWRPAEGGWIVSHDERMRTSQPRIFVAGEPAGIGGAEMAAIEGRIAALQAVLDVRGGTADQTILESLRREDDARRKASRFSSAVLQFFEPRLDALAGLATPETTICRCEEVTAGAVQSFLAENPHASDVNSVKLACRTGMGFCQGRYCQHTVTHMLAAARGLDAGALGAFTARAPVKPVPVAALADLREHGLP
ncbi:Hydrogen cyanide synthase subunit HcnB [Achromobacter anxifer]|uniref:Hydrogen cyanide synthase subunit HcnB n=1 Tax=Achromobacter anxifer TaxID=1287737 RepID=A0A6S7D7V2_9BURK|nr:NAD(P)/FAD-dependent oxidoreductase [Achromobacter anxifer]CAB3875507.1 Hydrogen cyanide synthase subunit HcnB [Achromobacter anxifer]